MSCYIPLHVHSHYSLQLGLSKPENIVSRCKEINAGSCAITDIGTVSGIVSFFKEMTGAGIKPIIGCELLIVDDHKVKTKNEKLSRIVVLAKNLDGWKSLIKIVSIANTQEFFNTKPRITFEVLKPLIKNQSLICIDGYFGSSLWNSVVDDNDVKYNYEELFNSHMNMLYGVFGKDNVFVEIQLFNDYNNSKNISLQIRECCKKFNHQRLAGIESYYCNREDSADQRILLCSNIKTTLPEISKKIIANTDTGFNHFFNSESYYILDNEDMMELYDQEELTNTFKVDKMCEEYSPLSKPTLPKFPVPEGFANEAEYLRQLCREGWKKKIDKIIPKDDQQIYVDRIKKELEILQGAGLSSYFLIVRDILHFIRTNGWLPGPGRGSAAGCLVSYLIGITSIDPIKYSLLFERFYNAGRNTKDRISMPDIDVDVPMTQRDTIIKYIKDKYGHAKVSQMITFNTLKGRGALKEVLRVHANVSFEEMNNITKHIPDEAKIADELQELKDEEGFASIIMWALENNSDKLKEWCYLDENNQLQGPLAKRFEQAIRMEGTKYNQSKHAAGIAIAATDLDDICPMIWDTKTEQNIAGLEMGDLESLGVIKFDILGIALLDKIMSVNSYIKERVK